MSNDALTLIDAYVAAVESAVATLQAHLRTKSLLTTVRGNRMLRRGEVDPTTSFEFHGIGCRFISRERVVEFDFGPEETVGGFDSWRLWLFAQGDPESFPNWQDRTAIETLLRELLADGLIELPGLEPSPHLYYLTREGRRAMEKMKSNGA